MRPPHPDRPAGGSGQQNVGMVAGGVGVRRAGGGVRSGHRRGLPQSAAFLSNPERGGFAEAGTVLGLGEHRAGRHSPQGVGG